MIRYANLDDINIIHKYDKHISLDELKLVVSLKRVIVIIENNIIVGFLRYNLFWDNTPFMNMLYILDGFRSKGYGKRLVIFWENEMKLMFHNVLTSTQDNETAKYFYRKLGYIDIGDFKIPNDEKELLLYKRLF